MNMLPSIDNPDYVSEESCSTLPMYESKMHYAHIVHIWGGGFDMERHPVNHARVLQIFSRDFEISELLRASHKVHISNSTWYPNMNSVAGAYYKYVPRAKTIIQTECHTEVAKSWLN